MLTINPDFSINKPQNLNLKKPNSFNRNPNEGFCIFQRRNDCHTAGKKQRRN